MSYTTKTAHEPRIIRAKGVHFNYLQFLWSRLNAIHSVAETGDFSLALKLLILDIPILPPDLQEIFGLRAEIIDKGINRILNYQIPQLQHIKDLFIKQMLREKYLQYYCKEHYIAFIKDLFDALESKGMIEKGSYEIPEGTSHTLKAEAYEPREVEDILKLQFKSQEEEEGETETES